MTKTSTEILNIYQFLEKCKYKNISDNKYIYYKSPAQIEQTKSCVCFDGAIYAYSKIKQLSLQYDPQILTIKGVRKENGILKNVAHSICIYHYNGKIGGIGKSAFTPMEFKEPIYSDIQQLALNFSFDFFTREILVQSYFIEPTTNFNILVNEKTEKLHTQNEVCNSKLVIPNYLEIKQITQYLTEIYNIKLEKIDSLLFNLRKK
jgi:hypothetical protein